MTDAMFIPDMVEEDEGGISATNPNRFVLPLVVAPTSEDKPDAFNTMRHMLAVLACKDVPDDHFEFDSSFIGPKAKKAFTALHGTITRHPESPLSIWGHTDPVGTLEYNQFLSERRAEAVHAVLVRDLDAWERLFSSVPARGKAIGDVWGDAAIETILADRGFPRDEAKKETLEAAIKRFEAARGDAAPKGKNDPAFRRRLFAEYMDAICVDKNGKAYQLKVTDFLGEGDEHGAFQGCSEFNPQLILAKAESDQFDKDKKFGKKLRAIANRDNRRVMIFFFEVGTKIDTKKWPCPRAKEGLQKCLDHRFSDHKDRTEKQFPLRRRRFGKQVRNETDRFSRPEMTFGCRFYHGLAQRSPCERDVQMYAIQLLIDAPKRTGVDGKERLVPVENVRWVATLGEEPKSPVVRGRTTKLGMIGIPFVSPLSTILLKVDLAAAVTGGIATVPDDPPPNTQRADTDRFLEEDTFIVYELRPDRLFRIKRKPNAPVLPEIPEETASLEPDADDPEVSDEEKNTGARQRLFNLGIGNGLSEVTTDEEFRKNLIRFQTNSGIAKTGKLDDATIDELVKQHGS
jgi:hypothetical protein